MRNLKKDLGLDLLKLVLTLEGWQVKDFTLPDFKDLLSVKYGEAVWGFERNIMEFIWSDVYHKRTKV